MWWRRLRYVLLLAALCAIATCPSARRACTANARAKEADDLLAYLADRATATYAATGRLPPTPAGPTPAASCCEQGGACAPDPAVWSAAGWRELGFTIDAPYRYTYQYAPGPTGTTAVLRATGDLDCDSQPSTFEVKLTVIAGRVLQTWSRTHPTE